ncbi:MAG: tetratricopeptide repeat protein [Bacteroidetes bacterium]|nr:tetratricopeptide repeat protein [Bacteroidota bacterium]
MQKGRIALVIGAVILALLLYFVGKTSLPKKENAETAHEQVISFDEYEAKVSNQLTANEKETISNLQKQLKAISKVDTATLSALYLQLGSFWRSKNNAALAAYYQYQNATTTEAAGAWENAGDSLVMAYKTTEDSLILNNLITFALRSYEAAVKNDSSNIDLKIKLADAYVNGSHEPMKGIGILKELESSHPENVKVLLSLGRMSIQSGQYDKAKKHLSKVLSIEPQNVEAMYFLAITEAQLGHNEEAIRLFEMCKILVNNESFNKDIDDIIKNLKK